MTVDIVLLLHSLLAFSALLANGTLLCCLLKRTQISLKSFAILMRIHVIADICNVLCCFGTMDRVIPAHWIIIFISYRPCTLVSPSLCYLLYNCFLVASCTSFYTTIAAFLARLHILRHGAIWSNEVWRLVGAVIVPPATVLAFAFALAKLPDDEARTIYHDIAPSENLTGLIITGNVPYFRSAIAMVVVFVLITPMYVRLWVVRSRILSRLSRTTLMMSEQTRELHRQFVKVLTLQALSPALVMTGVSTYAIRQFAELPALLNPLIVFACIPVFRGIVGRAVRGEVSSSKLEITATSSSSRIERQRERRENLSFM